MEGKWMEVKVITKSEALEPVTGIFYDLNITGVSIEDPNDILDREQGPLTWDFADINIFEYGKEAAVVKGYFSNIENIDNIIQHFNKKLIELKEIGFDIGEGKIIVNKVYEEDWANNWKQYYKPTKIGHNIVIKPVWEQYAEGPDEVIIKIDPGMAFGTGTHETTRMCVEALEKYVNRDAVVFDIGTGSGILAITAAKLNAKKVIGVDLDPVAVDSAKENVQLNDINNIEIVYGNLMDVIKGKANIIVANILAEIIILLSDDIKKFLLPNGYFITSGIIKDKKQQVVDKLKENGLDIINVETLGEWVCIVAKV
jgi:ribosomal protein L11 methyltransferase